jgi:Ca2+-binding EF-hand superfamily protein
MGKGFAKVEDHAKDLMGKMDKNKDGFLSFPEFTEGLKSLGLILTFQEEHTLMRRFDHNGDGRISLQEFCDTLTSA